MRRAGQVADEGGVEGEWPALVGPGGPGEVLGDRVGEGGRVQHRLGCPDGEAQAVAGGPCGQEHVGAGGGRVEVGDGVVPVGGQSAGAAGAGQPVEVQVREEELGGDREPAPGHRRAGLACGGHRLGDAAQVGPEATGSGRPRPHRNRGDARAEQSGQVDGGVFATGGGDPDHEVGPAGVPAQGTQVRGEHRSVQCGAGGAGEPAQGGGRLAVHNGHARVDGRAAGRAEPGRVVRFRVGGAGRGRSVQRDVVAERGARRRQRYAVVQVEQFPAEQRRAVAVADEVVGVHQQHMVVAGDP
jgi:hypothetical protein